MKLQFCNDWTPKGRDVLAVSVLFVVLAWVLWFHWRKQEQRYYENLLLANAIPM